jgi:hypothetical protein
MKSPYDWGSNDEDTKIDWKALRDIRSWPKGDLVIFTVFITLLFVLIVKWLVGD